MAPTLREPLGSAILDVSPATMHMLATSKDPDCAANLCSFRGDDGTGFIGMEPPVANEVAVGLRFPIDRVLADGPLFIPTEMEHKWAIYYHREKLLFVRSWLRQVLVVAQVQMGRDYIEVTSLRGAFFGAHEEPSFDSRFLDFLLRSHALETAYPAPLPPGGDADTKAAAIWCFSTFGNRVQFATSHEFPRRLPERPLRSYSLLHFAVARGDSKKARELLDTGLPVDLLAPDGSAPLHWALRRKGAEVIDLLLEHGSSIDVRSDEGATPLMTAIQTSEEMVPILLDRGADPNATDDRGFTALHRAAELGKVQIVESLLDRGAFPRPEAQGHTPQSLAATRGHEAIANLLKAR